MEAAGLQQNLPGGGGKRREGVLRTYWGEGENPGKADGVGATRKTSPG